MTFTRKGVLHCAHSGVPRTQVVKGSADSAGPRTQEPNLSGRNTPPCRQGVTAEGKSASAVIRAAQVQGRGRQQRPSCVQWEEGAEEQSEQTLRGVAGLRCAYVHLGLAAHPGYAIAGQPGTGGIGLLHTHR